MPQNRLDNTKQSMSSDDAGVMAAVAQQMQTSWEKKRKEKENTFFQEAKVELSKCVSTRTDKFAEAIEEMNGVYEKFVLDYASVEDNIRKLWAQLLEEQEKLLNLSEQKHRRLIETEKEREKGQVQGMAMAKKAMEDFNQLINLLNEFN
ncbi:hypothetical protein AcV5_010168 [Taiwanofungus camphoratus]|nr:hypothetical protein AcV5_010168 [Antrodia cinnamomea]KAI0946136.1 hypothetical protein AcV7_010187 [Antrodia cinnamomea]